jgi:hypothetical protein
MTEDERKAKLEQIRARMKGALGKDPKRARAFVASMVGAHVAARGADLEFAEDTPDDVREAALQGHLAQSLGELAQKPPILTDVPLLSRIFLSAIALLKTRKEPEEP